MKNSRNKTALFIGIAFGIFVFTMFLTDGRLYKTKTTVVKPVTVIGFEEALTGTYNSAQVHGFLWVQDDRGLKIKLRVNYELFSKLHNGDTVQLIEVIHHYKFFGIDSVDRTIAEEIE